MRHLFLRYPNRMRRSIEISIPFLSWLLITMPLWLSFWHPALVAYIIIVFDVYWFYKSVTIVYYAVRSYLTMQAHIHIDWLPLASKLPGFDKLYHVIIIPEYHEPIHILRRTFANLAAQEFPKDKMIIVLATENKDPQADETVEILKKEFGATFTHFTSTRHTLTEGEISGKSSNMAHALIESSKYLQKRGLENTYMTVTSCDADALPTQSIFRAWHIPFYLTLKDITISTKEQSFL